MRFCATRRIRRGWQDFSLGSSRARWCRSADPPNPGATNPARPHIVTLANPRMKQQPMSRLRRLSFSQVSSFRVEMVGVLYKATNFPAPKCPGSPVWDAMHTTNAGLVIITVSLSVSGISTTQPCHP